MTPSNDASSSDLQEQIEALLDLLPTLIRLLESLKGMGGGATQRLEEVLLGLARVSNNLEASANALTALISSDALSPALEARLRRIDATQDHLSQQVEAIAVDLRSITNWLTAAFDGVAEDAS